MHKRFLCLLLVGMLVIGNGMNAMAASVSSIQKKQTETQKKLNEVNKSITAIENKRKEVKSQINSLNADLVDTILTLEVLEADLEQKQVEIDEAQAEYDKWKAKEEEQYEAMKLRIQYMYEQGEGDYVLMLLEAESLSDLVNRADFVQEVTNYDEEKLNEYQETKDMAEETKAVLEEEQAELEEVQEAQQAYKAELNNKIAAAKSQVKNFDTELANAQAKAKEYQKTIKEQNEAIKKLQEDLGGGTISGGSDKGSSGGSGSKDDSEISVGGSGNGAAIANFAVQFVGNPYVSGGTSLTHGADCSGFTWAVHQHFGISIPRTSVAQSRSGQSISLGAIQPGDILYYGNHVGIYIGGGRIVHASTEKTGIKISSYTYRTPICARRYW